MPSLAELVTPMTVDEAKTVIYQALATRGAATTSWKPGAVVRTIVAAVAILASALSTLIAALARSAFLDYTSGAWLTLVARYVYETERFVGSFGTGSVTLDNAGGGAFIVEVGDLVVSNPATGATYRNTAAFTLDPLQVGVVVPITAVELGSASNSAPGAISAFVTPLLGASVSNPSAVVGLDAEGDETLRARCRAMWSTLGTGSTGPAYETWARRASLEVVRCRVRENDNVGVSADGHVTVVVASASGGVSAAAVAAVVAYVQARRTLCANIHVVSAVPVVIPVSSMLTARIGFGAAAVGAATANLATLSAEARIGDTVYRDAITEALMAPAGMVRAPITTPAVDVPLAFNEIPTLAPTLAFVEVS